MRLAAMTDTSRSIFLHGLWRCGSTYVWSRFRAAEETYCFLEPLHHALSRLTRDRIQRDTPNRAVANHHPKLDLPYFHEFGPLVKRRGVRNHVPQLAFNRYLLRPAEADKALFKYVKTLTSFAVQQKKTPVLGFNRTAFRMGWMTSHFPSWNLYIDRRPFDIWSSYEAHRSSGNYVFFTHWLLTIERNANHPVFSPLAARLPLRSGLNRLRKSKGYYKNILANMSQRDTYFMVFYIWIGTVLHALSHADAVLDMDLASPSYCRNLSENIRLATGLAVNFDDVKPVHYPRDGALELALNGVEDDVLSIFPVSALEDYFSRDIVAQKLTEISAEKRNILLSVLDKS